MKISKSAWIIHGFALLHAAVAFAFRSFGVDDTLVLTLLTMLMTVLLSMSRGYSVEITAAYVILVNVVGFLLGNGGAMLMNSVWNSPPVNHAVPTFLTTEVLGWCIVLVSRLFHVPDTNDGWSRGGLRWFVLAFFAIIIFRFVYVEVFATLYDSAESFLEPFLKLVSNAPALLLLVCGTLIYVRGVRKRQCGIVRKIVTFLILLLVLSAAVTVMAAYNFPFRLVGDVSFREIVGIFMITIMLEVTIYSIIYMIDYAMLANAARDRARTKAQEAGFQYAKLKHQVSPHFLFNSLNSLDGLVCDGRTEDASEYIHSLASVYRYILSKGEETVVQLRDEMDFVSGYLDLLRLRFGGALDVTIDIAPELMSRSVVPCAVQLLLENAVKHNVVSQENPLPLSIRGEDDKLVVRNALRPKLTQPVEGMGHGLTYIRQVYANLSERPVVIERTEEEYVVSLPLL